MTLPGFNPYVPRPIDLPTFVPLSADADLAALDEAKVFAAPDDPGEWPAWRTALARWRNEARARLAYDGAHYDAAPGDLFAINLAWLWDETLYDHDEGKFTVDRYVDAFERDFGPLDGIVLWHAYPVIGIDERDHLDLYEAIPELPGLVQAFHAREVRVFVTHYPWDGPRGTSGRLVELVRRTGADGTFLDLLREGSAELRAALDAVRPGLALEGESRVPLARIADHSMSWAQWFADSQVPGVLRAKWFERRHMLHHTRRWHRDHRDELHSAWLNGCGVLVWENVFGAWVGWNEGDRATFRAMRSVQRSHAPWLRSESWTPLADHPGDRTPVYASRWEHQGVPLWTVVNRGEDMDGPWLITDGPAGPWCELTSGIGLRAQPLSDGRVAVGGPLAAGGIAAVVVGDAPPPPVRPPEPGSDRSTTFPARAVIRTRASRVEVASAPPGMVAVEGGRFDLQVRYRLRETGLYGEALWIDEWKPLPPRLHATGTLTRSVELGRFAIGRREVSNAEFGRFLEAGGYRPKRAEGFDLAGRGEPDAPATSVELADARAYAAWAGARLPTEDEWQVAGERGLIVFREPRVWNLTESEQSDGRTRFMILKGGSAFANPLSEWYFDGGPRGPEWSARLLLMGAGLARSPWIGFRICVDLPG